jgi:hypothetical protein
MTAVAIHRIAEGKLAAGSRNVRQSRSSPRDVQMFRRWSYRSLVARTRLYREGKLVLEDCYAPI